MSKEATRPDRGTKRRIPAGEGRSWPECRVVRTGVSPLNPKVKWAELDCGHDVYRTRRPRIGATVVCEKCSVELSR